MAGIETFDNEFWKVCLEIVGEGFADVGVDAERLPRAAFARADGSGGCLNKKDRKYLGLTTADVDARVDIERAMGVAYSLSLRIASRGVNGGSIDRDDEDGADDGEELSRKYHGVG